MTAAKTHKTIKAANGAESVLLGLKSNGIDYLFANAGTDFPPVIEALTTLASDSVPTAITVPHETAGIAMAHGYYLVTGRPQATMVHVNVGLANTAMGVINAASDNIPVLVLSGRTPITETGRPGSRVTPIQYGQEMYDQSSLVSNVTKFHYEMRYPEQGAQLITRATTLAMSEPRGPVYLSLPREPLMEAIPSNIPQYKSLQRPASTACPAREELALAAKWLGAAENPLIICQRSDSNGRAATALSEFANKYAIGVIEPFSIRNVMATNDPMALGYNVKPALEKADVVLVLDSAVPWIEQLHKPHSATKIIHLAPDPLFQRMPVRGYQMDIAITSDTTAGIKALAAAMPEPTAKQSARHDKISVTTTRQKQAGITYALSGATCPMSAEWMSYCISNCMDKNSVVFSELGVIHSAMTIKGPNRVFSNPHSGGLGWALPAALGAQLADRRRLCIACIGDGSYMFANPVACHQIAEALDLPVLVMIKNNGMWNAVRRSVVASYPDGTAVKANRMPLTSLQPAPDYTKIASASNAYVERVEHGNELPAALQRALKIIRTERRQVLLDLNIAVSDYN